MSAISKINIDSTTYSIEDANAVHKSDIAQNLGNDPDMVLSQEAITRELDKLSEENDKIKNDLIQSTEKERSLVFINGSFVHSGGGFIDDPNAKNTGFIPVFGYSHYKIYSTISTDGCSVSFYDVKKQFLPDSKIVGSYNGIGTIPNNAYYVVFSSYGENNESAYLYKENATEENHNARLTELEATIEWTPNLYNHNDGVENGYYWNDVFYPSDEFYTVTIRVRTGVKKIKPCYTHNYISYYNQKSDLIGGDANIIGYNHIINIPNDCYFVKITSYRAAISPNVYTCYDVTNGDVTNSVPYGYHLINCLSIINSNSKLLGKKIMFFGDSITESGHMYRTPLVRNTGMVEVACFAISGATIRNHDDTVMDGNPTFGSNNTVPNQVQKLLNNISSYDVPDIIIISASTNDWATGNEYDESQFTNESGFIDVDTLNLKQNFTGCMRWMYEKLMGVYPNAKVFFATPLQSTAVNRDYATQKQKRNCIVSVCNRMSCQYIDAFYNSGVYDVKASKHLYDGLHPHEAGGELLAKCYEMELTNKYI